MRILIVALVCLISQSLLAQPRSSKETQWWIGFEGGIGTTFIDASNAQSVIQGVPQAGEKDYQSPGKITFNAGVMLGFEFRDNFSIALHPSVHNYNIQYSTMYNWTGEDGSSSEINFNNEVRLTYFELPLIFRFDFDQGSGPSMSGGSNVRIFPFVQGGGVYGTLIRSLKEVELSGVDRSPIGEQPLTATSISRNADELFLNTNFFLMAGGGVAFILGNARLGLEVNYRHGMNVITNRANRFSDDIFIAGTYDAIDDIKLRSVEALISFHMPLKFLTSKDFKAF